MLISDIAFSADGILLGCNKATMGNGTWKIYKWANDDATPQVYSPIDKAPKTPSKKLKKPPKILDFSVLYGIILVSYLTNQFHRAFLLPVNKLIPIS